MSTKQYYTMKWIALVSMLIDHTASAFHEAYNWNTDFYLFCRTIGRLAFPLFCFMLVESFYFTENRLRHLGKIAVLSIISEIPFDLALRGSLVYINYQNVCITLFLGFAMLCVIYYGTPYVYRLAKSDEIVKRFAVPVFNVFVLFMFGITASILHTDYGFSGIFLIWGLNAAIFIKHTGLWRAVVMMLFIAIRFDVMYVICLVDLAVIYILTFKSDNSDKTKVSEIITSKWSKVLCSVFYPVHLTIIAIFKAIL